MSLWLLRDGFMCRRAQRASQCAVTSQCQCVCVWGCVCGGVGLQGPCPCAPCVRGHGEADAWGVASSYSGRAPAGSAFENRSVSVVYPPKFELVERSKATGHSTSTPSRRCAYTEKQHCLLQVARRIRRRGVKVVVVVIVVIVVVVVLPVVVVVVPLCLFVATARVGRARCRP